MGKTGTSSIQDALRAGGKELIAQNAHYLGMWLDAIDPAYKGHAGFMHFYDQDEETLISAAKSFSDFLQRYSETTGVETFILSNEAFFGPAKKISPFLKALQVEIDLCLIAYIRDPAKWLPSAFTQWELYHKQHKGPIQSFPERAKTLIGQYNAIKVWIEDFSEVLIVRKHDTTVDVVKDFALTCNIGIPGLSERALERAEPAETLLRAAFNNRYEQAVFPETFNNFVLPASRKVAALDDLAQICFPNDQINEVIEERRPLFEYMRNRLGPEFDFLSGQTEPKAMPDPDKLQKRLIDYLVEITFLQAERIKRLENQMQELTKEK